MNVYHPSTEVLGGVMVTTMAPHAIDQGFESLAQPTHIFLGISPLGGNISTTNGGESGSRT